ncbi:SgcJ/EcaC family oxidoreductase [Rhodococcus gannanensis]|uniref:SgcJ/EcaC family oxidoreductase n=1 Tax=Rhodococcus gannanensis TaxID=1960308 RepID=A0ABW4P1C5_9NOCA
MRDVKAHIRTTVAGVGAVGLLFLAGCSNSEDPGPPSNEDVAGLLAEWNDALATGDPETVAALYAPDAVLIPTVSNEIRTGHDAIVAYFTDFLPRRPSAVVEQSVITALDTDHVIDSGVYRFTLHDGNEVSTVDARYSFVYEKQGDDWLIVNHHSSAMPED